MSAVLPPTTLIAATESGGLSAIDLTLLGAYLLATVAWGAWPRSKKVTDEQYLLGGRNVAWPWLLLSIVATETSTVTFLSLPGNAFAEGGDLGFMQITLGYVVGRVAVALLMLPEYFRGKMFTAYEMLEERFGPSVRAVASTIFLLSRNVADGLRLFLTALALQQAVGWDFTSCVLVIAAATTVYATLGGVSSVVANDCLQLTVYTLGALVAGMLLGQGVPGGWGGVFEHAAETGRLHVFNFDPSVVGSGMTFWSGLVGGAFLSLATHGVDHMMVQRYLCAASPKRAQLALVLSGPVVAAQFLLFLVLGLGLAAFYASQTVDYAIGSSDQAFAAFLAHETPTGLRGLLFASILAAAMSTLSSSLNASAGVFVKDLLGLWKRSLAEARPVAVAKVATVAFGVLQAAVALGANGFELDKLKLGELSVISAVLAIAGFATGILVGLFALGVLRQRASQTAAFAALCFGSAVCTLVMLNNVGAETPAERVHWTWNALIASTVTLATGYLADAIVVPKRERP